MSYQLCIDSQRLRLFEVDFERSTYRYTLGNPERRFYLGKPHEQVMLPVRRVKNILCPQLVCFYEPQQNVVYQETDFAGFCKVFAENVHPFVLKIAYQFLDAPPEEPKEPERKLEEADERALEGWFS